MRWDEEADDYAVAHHTYEHLGGQLNQWHFIGIIKGARWQRNQLRTDEAVERVGQAIAQAHGQTPVLWTQYEGAARAAITALLGDE